MVHISSASHSGLVVDAGAGLVLVDARAARGRWRPLAPAGRPARPALEARGVDADEVHHGVVVERLPVDSKDSSAAACASASSISTPGITGRCGKWPVKKGSLIVTFFSALIRTLGLELEHTVDQQDGIAVRQLGAPGLLHVDVDGLRNLFYCTGASHVFFSSALRRSRRRLCSVDGAAWPRSSPRTHCHRMGNRPLYWPGFKIDRVTTVAAVMCT
jgi:hypothetical protein